MGNRLTKMPLPKRKPVEEDTYTSPDDELAKKILEQKKLGQQNKTNRRLMREHPGIVDMPIPKKPEASTVDFGDEGATVEGSAAEVGSPQADVPNPADYKVVLHPTQGPVIRHTGTGEIISTLQARNIPGFESLLDEVKGFNGGGGLRKAMEAAPSK
jgi:hypothetical protein